MQDRINKLFAMLEGEYEPADIRSSCIELGIELAQLFGEKIDAWEKSQLASAISSLNWNLSINHPASFTGLRLCLYSLNKSLVPKEYRSPDYPVKEDDLKDVSAQDIVEAFRSL